MAGRLNMLYRDRRAHARTTLLMKREARMSREAWGQSMDASDFARSEVMSLRTTVLGQQAVITELQAAGRRGQAAITELLAADRRRQAFVSLRHHNASNFQAMNMPTGVNCSLWQARDGLRNWLCYAGGCFPMIYGSVVASKLKTMQEAIEIATELMDKKIRTFAKRQTESREEKQVDNARDKRNNNRRANAEVADQQLGRAYTAGTGEKKQYGGSKPLCSKCNYHHNGPCAPRCHKCNKVSHLARDCRSTANANNANNQRGTGSGQKPTCYECGA
ncbi:putative reverse transcriptase domain-containing protein [Tanacetum coccineum]